MTDRIRKILEFALLLIAAFSAFLLTDFGGFWMPSSVLMWAATVVVVAGSAIGALLFFDEARDEREESIRNSAARAAYGIGLAILLAGIAYRAFAHVPADPWALGAAIAMIAAIVISRNRGLDR